MAIRFSPILLKTIRCFSSSTSSISAAAASSLADKSEPSTPKEAIYPIDTLNFHDSKQLFASMSTSQMLNSTLNLHLSTLDPFVDIGIRVMRSGLLEKKVVGRVMMEMIKKTFYDHFCAGEGLEDATRTLQRLWDDGLRGVLYYALEDASDNEGCDHNFKEFQNTIEMTSLLPPASVSFACVKITAICPISLLKRISDLLRWEYKHPSFHLPWKLDSLPILSKSSPLYHTPSQPDALTDKEEHDLQLALQRFSQLCEKCLQINLSLLVDAEYTSVQPAIDYFTYWAALRFNKDEKPIVYGTIQSYLIDAKERLIQVTEAAERNGISVAFKLVRGAYITNETQLASSFGVASPIHASIQDTHACYNECASFMLEKIAEGHGSVLLATHNMESGKLAATKAEELQIGKGNQKLQFAQLKGLADGLSLGLRNAGFNVSKYLPFGPVDKVIPYLLRRAEENRGLLAATKLDRELMRKELKRRFKGEIFGEVDKMMVT